ncbi:MAG: hypothetical protein QW576_02410 [Candidatus Korarchaeum sp.]
MRVELRLPPDSTFLSQVMYEGLLYLIHSAPQSSFGLDGVSLSDGAICRAYEGMSDERIESISVNMTGNDKVDKLLDAIGVKERPEKKTYRGLLKLLKDKCKEASLMRNRDSITLQIKLDRGEIFLDSPHFSELAAPQLFKIDRYTGISAGETGLISKQLGLRSSPEVILIGLLGVYSSHIVTVRQQGSAYHYFVFLSVDDMLRVLSSGDRARLEHVYFIKEQLRELLMETLEASVMSEIMTLEVMLSSAIRAELRKRNLDMVGFNVFRISPEGQTYKVYETIPLTVYANPMFYQVLLRRRINAEGVCEALQEALSPNKAIMKALASFNSPKKLSEADSVLRGVLALYRFITLADTYYLFQFLRYLSEARAILRDDRKALRRIQDYEYIERSLSRYL